MSSTALLFNLACNSLELEGDNNPNNTLYIFYSWQFCKPIKTPDILKPALLKPHSLTFTFSSKTFFCMPDICTVQQAIIHTWYIKRATSVVSSLPVLRVRGKCEESPSSSLIICGCGYRSCDCLPKWPQEHGEKLSSLMRNTFRTIYDFLCVSASSPRTILIHES